ncbi:MAG TPA: hypothetical protein DCG85_05415 [Lachnospiraceae bacterium]|nr:hypothetical protein [Lachnospiraceae bacterium]
MSRILLVDDDSDMLMLTGRWLEKAGYEVDRAASGSEALSCLEKIKPDLILLDYAMPGMDGPAVLSAIRENGAYENIPVYYRTGMDDNDITPVPSANGIIPKSEGKPGLIKAVSEALA